MAALKTTRGAQRPLVATFVWDVSQGDTLAPVVGNTFAGAIVDPYNKQPGFTSVAQALGNFYAGVAQIYDFIFLPVNAVVLGGEIFVQTAVVGPTVATLSLGDTGDSVNSSSATRYASAVSLLSVGRTALTLSGIVALSGENIRATLTQTVANATAGKVYVRVMYETEGRQDEPTGY